MSSNFDLNWQINLSEESEDDESSKLLQTTSSKPTEKNKTLILSAPVLSLIKNKPSSYKSRTQPTSLVHWSDQRQPPVKLNFETSNIYSTCFEYKINNFHNNVYLSKTTNGTSSSSDSSTNSSSSDLSSCSSSCSCSTCGSSDDESEKGKKDDEKTYKQFDPSSVSLGSNPSGKSTVKALPSKAGQQIFTSPVGKVPKPKANQTSVSNKKSCDDDKPKEEKVAVAPAQLLQKSFLQPNTVDQKVLGDKGRFGGSKELEKEPSSSQIYRRRLRSKTMDADAVNNNKQVNTTAPPDPRKLVNRSRRNPSESRKNPKNVKVSPIIVKVKKSIFESLKSIDNNSCKEHSCQNSGLSYRLQMLRNSTTNPLACDGAFPYLNREGSLSDLNRKQNELAKAPQSPTQDNTVAVGKGKGKGGNQSKKTDALRRIFMGSLINDDKGGEGGKGGKGKGKGEHCEMEYPTIKQRLGDTKYSVANSNQITGNKGSTMVPVKADFKLVNTVKDENIDNASGDRAGSRTKAKQKANSGSASGSNKKSCVQTKHSERRSSRRKEDREQPVSKTTNDAKSQKGRKSTVFNKYDSERNVRAKTAQPDKRHRSSAVGSRTNATRSSKNMALRKIFIGTRT